MGHESPQTVDAPDSVNNLLERQYTDKLVERFACALCWGVAYPYDMVHDYAYHYNEEAGRMERRQDGPLTPYWKVHYECRARIMIDLWKNSGATVTDDGINFTTMKRE
jgi:hypothetical protein